jgi:hypothetical protein
MRVFLILFLILAACAKEGSQSSGEACGPKSVLSRWIDDSSNSFDLSYVQGFANRAPIQEVVYGVQCSGFVEVTGGQCSGQVIVSGFADSGMSNICSGTNGTYDFSRSSGGLLIGKHGSPPLLFH